jgi:uncharacterized protein (TIGR00369 family)
VPDPVALPESPVAHLLGRTIRSLAPEAGTIEVEFRPREEFLNTTGTIQGGMLAAMLDSTIGPALRATLAPGEVAPTLELKVSFLRPAPLGPLTGRGRVVHKARSIAFLEGDLRNAAGEVVATATATARIVARGGS